MPSKTPPYSLSDLVERQEFYFRERKNHDLKLVIDNWVKFLEERVWWVSKSYIEAETDIPVVKSFKTAKDLQPSFQFSVMEPPRKTTSEKSTQYFLWLDLDIEKYLESLQIHVAIEEFDRIYSLLINDNRVFIVYKSRSYGLRAIIPFEDNLVCHQVYRHHYFKMAEEICGETTIHGVPLIDTLDKRCANGNSVFYSGNAIWEEGTMRCFHVNWDAVPNPVDFHGIEFEPEKLFKKTDSKKVNPCEFDLTFPEELQEPIENLEERCMSYAEKILKNPIIGTRYEWMSDMIIMLMKVTEIRKENVLYLIGQHIVPVAEKSDNPGKYYHLINCLLPCFDVIRHDKRNDDYISNVVKKSLEKELEAYDIPKLLEKYCDSTTVEGKADLADNVPHLQESEAFIKSIQSHKITDTRSIPGTGKTEALEPFAKEATSFLSVHARVTDHHKSCKEIGLTSYLEGFENDRISIVINSIKKIRTSRRFDIISIDEIYAVLFSIFLEKTFKPHERHSIYEHLLILLSRAKKVILSSADITRPIHDLLMNDLSRFITGDINSVYVENDFQRNNRELNYYDSKNDFFDSFYDLINKGKKVYIFCDYKRSTYNIGSKLRELGVKALVINQDEKNKEEQLDFINNPVEHLKLNQQQAVIVSPTIITSVNLNEVYFDHIFCLIEGTLLSPIQIKQAIGRVRCTTSELIPTHLYHGTKFIRMEESKLANEKFDEVYAKGNERVEEELLLEMGDHLFLENNRSFNCYSKNVLKEVNYSVYRHHQQDKEIEERKSEEDKLDHNHKDIFMIEDHIKNMEISSSRYFELIGFGGKTTRYEKVEIEIYDILNLLTIKFWNTDLLVFIHKNYKVIKQAISHLDTFITGDNLLAKKESKDKSMNYEYVKVSKIKIAYSACIDSINRMLELGHACDEQFDIEISRMTKIWKTNKLDRVFPIDHSEYKYKLAHLNAFYSPVMGIRLGKSSNNSNNWKFVFKDDSLKIFHLLSLGFSYKWDREPEYGFTYAEDAWGRISYLVNESDRKILEIKSHSNKQTVIE